jgi:hypothetical protein
VLAHRVGGQHRGREGKGVCQHLLPCVGTGGQMLHTDQAVLEGIDDDRWGSDMALGQQAVSPQKEISN